MPYVPVFVPCSTNPKSCRSLTRRCWPAVCREDRHVDLFRRSARSALSKMILRNRSPSLNPFISTLNVPIFSRRLGSNRGVDIAVVLVGPLYFEVEERDEIVALDGTRTRSRRLCARTTCRRRPAVVLPEAVEEVRRDVRLLRTPSS